MSLNIDHFYYLDDARRLLNTCKLVCYLQVSPSTLNLKSCNDNENNKITIKSTIPVFKDRITGQYLDVGFHLPSGLRLPPAQCIKHSLTEYTRNITVGIIPNCTAHGKDLRETKVILITFYGGGAFWTNHSASRTVWVRICLY